MQVNETLYISGQIGFIPETMKIVDGGAASETDQVIKSLEFTWTVNMKNK